MEEGWISLFERKIFFPPFWLSATIDKFRTLVSFLIVSSIFIGIINLLLIYFCFLLLGLALNLYILLAAFFLTFSIYNLNKLTDIAEDLVNAPERAEYVIGKEKVILCFSIIAYIFALLLGISTNILSVPILLFPFFIGLIYSTKILSVFGLSRLKDIVFMKNFIVTLSWTVEAIFLSAIFLHGTSLTILLLFYFVFTKIFINAVSFDIRDIEGDRISGVETIPVVFGRRKAKNLLLILNSTFIPWLAFSYLAGYFHQYLFVLIFAIAYGYWYILHFCKEGLKIGKSMDLLVDGEWIPIVLLCLITQYLVGFL
ncbi:Digeranylgeranylglyceryl phosphate synthase [ANME-1 cluster archaeon GoMg2]|nr:Digeranylgeranylglyceryl phosphate synthase [ANME-1 cluster archaeon GoMg2]